MTWLTPWLAGIAAAIAVPTLIILYFLKPVSYTHLTLPTNREV